MLSGRLLFYLKKKEQLAGIVTRWHSMSLVVPLVVIPYHSLSLFVIRCHSFSFVITRCHSLYKSLSLVVPLVVIRCHSLSFVVARCTTCCHSLILVVTRCTTCLSFYKRLISQLDFLSKKSIHVKKKFVNVLHYLKTFKAVHKNNPRTHSP